MIVSRDARGIAGQLRDIIKHYPVWRRDGSTPEILLQRLHQLFIQGHATQKLCVRFDSIMATIDY